MSATTTTGGGEKNIYSRDKLVEIRNSMELQAEGGENNNSDNRNDSNNQQQNDLSWRSSAGKDVFHRSGGYRGGGGDGGERPPRGERPDRAGLERGGQQAPAGSESRMGWDRDAPRGEGGYGRGGGFRGGDRDAKSNFRAPPKEGAGNTAGKPPVRTGGFVSSPTASSPIQAAGDDAPQQPTEEESKATAPKKNPWGNRSVPTASQATALASAPAPLAAVDTTQEQGFPTFSQSASNKKQQDTNNSSPLNQNSGGKKKAPPPPIASLDDLSSPTVPSPSVAPPPPVALGDDDCGLPDLPQPAGKSPIAPSPASATKSGQKHQQQQKRKTSNSSASSPTMALGALGGLDDDEADYPMLGGVNASAPQGRKQRQQQQLSNQQQQNAYSRRPVPKVVPVTERSDLKDSEFPSLDTL